MKQIAILFLSLIGSVSVFAQPKEPYPFMYFPSKTGSDRVTRFNSQGHQLEEIKSNQNEIDPHFKTEMTMVHFREFLYYIKKSVPGVSYLTFYIGIPNNGSNKKDKISIIVAPCDANQLDIGTPFKFETDFDVSNPNKSKVVNGEFVSWTGNWNRLKPKKLLDKMDEGNYPGGIIHPNKPYFDTKYVTYCVDDFIALFETVSKYVSLNGNIICKLGATDNSGVPNLPGKLKNRTVIQMTLLDANNKEVDLEGLNVFQLPKASTACPGKKKNKTRFAGSNDVDNGQLCPYNCPK